MIIQNTLKAARLLASMLLLSGMAALPVQAASPADPPQAGLVGITTLDAHSAERDAMLPVTIWYPAAPGGVPAILGESPFFIGTEAARGAPVGSGRYPLILLSHGAGLGGTPEAMSWVATALAGRGFIVAAPTHPGNGGARRSAAQTIKLWLRPGDIGASLDAVRAAPVFADHLALGAIGLLGLSMGGNTALAIAGARVDPGRLARYCDDAARNASLCQWLAASGVDLHHIDLGQAGRDNRDARIGFVMAIDPAPVDIFDPASFSAIDVPVSIVNLGRPGSIVETARADGIATAIANARYATIDDASHFSLFGICKQAAAALAEAEEIGDPICADGGGRPRTAIHAELVEMAAPAFKRALGEGDR